MTGAELADRIRVVLRELSMLSETPAVSYDGDRVKSGGSKSAPPSGVRFGGRRDLRDLSYAEFWNDRFRSVRGDAFKLQHFLYLAELDLARVRKRHEPANPHESADGREDRVLVQYEGLDPLEAAVIEDCTEVWMRKVRLKHKREPETGY